MSRVNHADTLVTELRELQRRLRLLEAIRVAPATAVPAPVTPAAWAPDRPSGHQIPLTPSRPVDWPACTAAQWEELFGMTVPDSAQVSLRAVADRGTTGAVRIVLDGNQANTEFAVTEDEVTYYTAQVPAGPLAVQARRFTGDGAVRLWAILLP